jgi:hypothetical protein
MSVDHATDGSWYILSTEDIVRMPRHVPRNRMMDEPSSTEDTNTLELIDIKL